MKKLLSIVFVSFLLSENAHAEIIVLKCVDNINKTIISPKIDINNKTAILGSREYELFIGVHYYKLVNDEGIMFYVNRISGGYTWTYNKKPWGKGICFKDPKNIF
jgi:hypothetical protein